MRLKTFTWTATLLLSSSILLAACSEQKEQSNEPKKEQTSQQTTNTEKEQEKRDAGGYIINQKTPEKEHYVKGILIANKIYPMPQNFAPGESKEARKAFEQLNKAAKKAGYTFDAFSTYRSYDRQKVLYDGYVKRDGKEAADTYSARPGFSEHQTGLAFDIGEVGKPGDYADDRFGETEAGKWLAKNAHKYGFIMRYPKGKEKVTGYKHESWHFRYVGEKIATEIYENNSTLEEYLGAKG